MQGAVLTHTQVPSIYTSQQQGWALGAIPACRSQEEGPEQPKNATGIALVVGADKTRGRGAQGPAAEPMRCQGRGLRDALGRFEGADTQWGAEDPMAGDRPSPQ